MNKAVSLIVNAGYADRILTTGQLARILGGTDDRRYSQVKRALRSGELVRIKRGRYVVAEQYRKHPLHPFALAQSLVVGSYVSLETALAFHGWIPEAVFATASVTPGRKSKTIVHPDFGRFEFVPLALHTSEFLTGVERHIVSEQAVLVASPLRALMDLVAYRRLRWKNMSWIRDGLRIDENNLLKTRAKDLSNLQNVYKHSATIDFLSKLGEETRSMKTSQKVSRQGSS